MSLATLPWGWVIVGGPILLGVILFWGMMRTRRADKRRDPDTPSDDPSQGMTGHD